MGDFTSFECKKYFLSLFVVFLYVLLFAVFLLGLWQPLRPSFVVILRLALQIMSRMKNKTLQFSLRIGEHIDLFSSILSRNDGAFLPSKSIKYLHRYDVFMSSDVSVHSLETYTYHNLGGGGIRYPLMKWPISIAVDFLPKWMIFFHFPF